MTLETTLVSFFCVLIFLLACGLVAFWVWMLVDCVTRKYEKEDEKLIWVLIIVFTQIIGAFIYFFVIKQKDKKVKGGMKNGKK